MTILNDHALMMPN